MSTLSSSAAAPLTFAFPPHYTNFPPFFTLQPVLSTRTAQLTSWSTFIQSYCRHHRLFSLTLVDALPTPLFTNPSMSRGLSLRDARTVIHWMTTPEGGSRAEWISNSTSLTAKRKRDGESDEGDGSAWIYWRNPDEWAQVLEEWVERTGQKGSVVTLYEIAESDATRKEEFWGMEPELLKRCVGVCVRRGKAQVFGNEGSEGVKFF